MVLAEGLLYVVVGGILDFFSSPVESAVATCWVW